MFRGLIPAVMVMAACAQTVVDPTRLGELLPLLEARDAGTLRCTVTTLVPVLDFSLRFQAVYTVRVPLAQFSGPDRRLSVLVRVRPETGGAPVYLGSQLHVPDSASSAQIMEVGGGYQVGVGRYSARALVYDETGRMCRQEWAVEARLGPGQTGINVAMPPNTAAGFSVTHPVAAGQPKLESLTVLLDAAPFDPRMSKLPATDVVTLLSAVSSLLEQAPARRVRMVVFNLDQQKELMREDGFSTDHMSLVEAALNTVQMATVDYHLLQQPRGYLALLADLVNREREAQEPSEVVVFLSSRVRYHDKVPADSIVETIDKPRFSLIQFRPQPGRIPAPDITDSGGRRGRGGATIPRADSMGGRGGRGGGFGPSSDYPDSIAMLVSRLKGKTFAVHTPTEFVRAIERIVQARSKR